jgi:hypothetical protein
LARAGHFEIVRRECMYVERPENSRHDGLCCLFFRLFLGNLTNLHQLENLFDRT